MLMVNDMDGYFDAWFRVFLLLILTIYGDIQMSDSGIFN